MDEKSTLSINATKPPHIRNSAIIMPTLLITGPDFPNLSFKQSENMNEIMAVMLLPIQRIHTGALSS
jgi:hypothetical protein